MSQTKQKIVSVRSFIADDAEDVSALFRAVYGDCYVYPEVYLPSMIHRNNIQQRWQSLVACIDGEIVGHAVLWTRADCLESAELALNVVHPKARGMGIATILGRNLCDQARQQGLRTLTIKQVSSHAQSQRLAQRLGFYTTGLMLDYVASPFGNERRESVVFGCLPLQPHPMPSLPWSPACRDWVAPMEQYFGICSSGDAFTSGPSITVISHEQRIEVTLNDLHSDHLQEVAHIPKGRLTYLKLVLNQRTPAAMQQLRTAGFVHAGFMPRQEQGWYGLMQRGYGANALDLYCPTARKLYRDSLRESH